MKRKSLLIMLLVALFVPLAMNAQNNMLKKSKGSVQTKGSVQLEMRASTNEMPSNPLLSKLESAKEAALEELNNRAGDRGTYSFSNIPTTGWSTNGGTKTINGIDWTYSRSTYIGINNSRIQIGSQNNPQTTAWTIQTPISSFGQNVRVTDVSITGYTTRTTATYSISVGGTSVKSGNLTTSSATYSATNLNYTSGNIVVTMTGSNSSRAMYLSNITVTYQDAGCSAPTNFAATSVTSNSATLSWTETGTSDTWVVLYMAEDDEESSYEIVTTNPYTLTGLNPLTTYYAMVLPYCGDNDQYSEMITFTTADLPCPRPDDLVTSDITNNSATFSWTGEGESYNLQYRTPGGREILFYEGFENGKDGWTETSVGSNTGVYSGAPNSGTYMYGFVRNGSNIQYLISPELSNIEEGSVVAFYHMAYNANATIYVGYSSTTTATNQFTWGSAQTVTASTSYAMYAMEIPAGTKYVGIRVNAMTSDAYYFVDDFFVAGPYVEPGEWHTVNNVTSPYTATGLDPETDYEWQVQAVCGGGDGESLWAESDIFTTLSACDAPYGLTSSNITNSSAALSWTGFTDTYNVQYREYDPDAPVTIILTAGDVWGDGSGYQMLLDADATAVDGGTISDYSIFEYKIPTNADYSASTSNVVVNNSVSIQIPAGTYDWYITNPTPGYQVYVASSNGNVGGSQDNYVFDAGKTYEFVVSTIGDHENDRVDVTITADWTTVNGVTNPYTLTGLDMDTQYEVQVQGVNCDGNGGTSDWSASEYFTTLNGILVTSITASDVTVLVGETATITPTVLPSDATNPAVTYTSNDETIATVTSAGVVTGVAVGTTTITIAATDGSGVTGTISVTVNPIAVTGITAENVTVVNGETATISYTVAPTNATDQSVTFTVEDETIATVDAATGVVTGVSVGTTTITITSVSNPEVQTEITVTVTSNPNAVQFTVNTPANAHPGDVITVDFMLAAPTTGTYTGFTGLDVSLYFETAAFQYNSKANGAVADAVSDIDMGQVAITGPNTNNPNRVKAILATPANYPVTTEGIVFSATFTVLQDVELGNYTFDAAFNEFDYTTGEVGNSNTVDILYEFTPSTVTIAALEQYFKHIGAYGTNGYSLIASPIGDVDPEDVANMIDNTQGADGKYPYDLFRFDQTQALEWQNYRYNYPANTFNLNAGQGYLYANSNDVDLVFTGTAYSGDGVVTLSKTETTAGDGLDFPGWNLVGNPFATEVVEIKDENENTLSFYTMTADGRHIVSATNTTVQFMEGVFVVAEVDGEEITFTPVSANEGSKGSLAALNLSDGNEFVDRAIVRFGQGRQLPKLQLDRNSSKLYIPQDGQDYAVVYSEEMGALPVNFKAENNGTYCLNLSSENVEFAYLHLIDNKTGNDIDLLQTPSYSFEAKTTDYESRFKLVFATGDNSNDDNFAFFSNGSFVINNDGAAELQVIDLMGRILSSETINGCANVNVNAAPGVYMLRLINGDNVKVQKVVVK